MQTTLELFLCTMSDNKNILYHRTALDITASTEDPDCYLVTMLSGLTIDANPEDIYAHSTSWRFSGQGIILTYMALTPQSSLINLPTKLLYQKEHTTRSRINSQLLPRPYCIEEKDVVVHGLGHFHYLAEKKGEPFLLDALKKTGTAAILARYTPTVAGRLHVP